jgi:hypothetical protein
VAGGGIIVGVGVGFYSGQTHEKEHFLETIPCFCWKIKTMEIENLLDGLLGHLNEVLESRQSWKIEYSHKLLIILFIYEKQSN